MMMRRALFALPLLFLAVLFLTALASAGYAQSGGAGENVVVISVAKVSMPGKLPGLCQIHGAVEAVWQGKAFRKGQAISLPVPCGSNPQPLRPPGADTPLADPQVLRKSKQGVAHLNDAGGLIWRETARGYRGLGPVSGYRVYDGALLPLKQAAL